MYFVQYPLIGPTLWGNKNQTVGPCLTQEVALWSISAPGWAEAAVLDRRWPRPSSAAGVNGGGASLSPSLALSSGSCSPAEYQVPPPHAGPCLRIEASYKGQTACASHASLGPAQPRCGESEVGHGTCFEQSLWDVGG